MTSLARLYSASHPMTAGVGSSPSVDLNWISGRNWMDVVLESSIVTTAIQCFLVKGHSG